MATTSLAPARRALRSLGDRGRTTRVPNEVRPVVLAYADATRASGPRPPRPPCPHRRDRGRVLPDEGLAHATQERSCPGPIGLASHPRGDLRGGHVR